MFPLPIHYLTLLRKLMNHPDNTGITATVITSDAGSRLILALINR